MVSDAKILGEIERKRDDLRSAAKGLVRAANRGGGEDNITVVFFEIEGGDGERGRAHAHPAAPAGAARRRGGHARRARPRPGRRRPALEARNGRPPEPGARLRASGRRVLLATLAVIAVLLAFTFAVWGLWRSHFVGAESNGHIAVYQGVPWNVAGNLRLYRTIYVSPVLTAQLSQPERQKLFDHTLRSKSSALAEVHQYEVEIGR